PILPGARVLAQDRPRLRRSMAMRTSRPAPTVLAAAVTAAALLATACGSVRHHSLLGDPSPIGAAAGAAPTTTAAPPTAAPSTTAAPTTVAPTTTAAPGRPPRPYAVGSVTLDMTDTSRKAGATQGRHLPTLVLYPTAGGDPNAETPN